MDDPILYDVADGVATIVLNRPERLNAFTGEMARALVATFDRTDADDDVRAVIVTGAGRAFCAGADLEAGGDAFDVAGQGESPIGVDGTVDYSHPTVRDLGGTVSLRIFRSLKPVIGAINGPAVGIGLTMTLPMDFRLVAQGAKLGFVFVRRGIIPEAASSYFLPRVVGIAQTLEWTLTGRLFLPDEALAGGLVRSIHAPEALMVAAQTLAREIADNGAPVSVALTRQMMWRGLGLSHPMEAHRIDSRAMFARGRSADASEGVTSFLEKRPPSYPDRVGTGMPDFYPWFEEPDYA